MNLETLELVFDFNIERIQEAAKRLKPQIDQMMTHVESRTETGSNKAERNLDMSKGLDRMTKQFDRMNTNFERQMERLSQVSEKSSSKVGQNFSKGFQRARRESGQEVDAIVKDIDSKMKQARAQQEKLAYMRSQRQSVNDSRDPQSAIQYEEQIARAEAAMTRFQGSAQKMAQGLRSEFKVIPQEMNGITQAMAQNEAQVDRIRSRINQLKDTYQNQLTPKGNFSDGFTMVDSKASLKTQVEIEKQTQQMNKAIQSNEQLGQAYSRLEDRLRQVTPAVSELNTELGDTRSYDSASQGVGRFEGAIGRTKRRMSDFFSRFSRGSREVQRNSRQMSNPLSGMNKVVGQFTRRLLILGLAYRAFSGAATYMGKAVLANEEFSRSLNEIRVNLATAFYPIYQAVMPALNAFIQWVSRATAYLAQFIAMLFGTTYSAARRGASALNEQIANMDDTGAAADRNAQRVRRFQRSLMGFDEINTLDMSDDDPDISGNDLKTPGLPNGIDFNIPEPKTPAWMENFAKRVRDILSRLFAPMKAAWDTHGQTVMDAWKYALNETWGLIQSIGRDFMKVWENGTGERTIGNILLLVAELGFWIGDIARAFRLAWDEAGRGEALIQSIFDAFNEVLELILAISGSWREAWNDGTGQRIAGHLLEIMTNIGNTIGNLSRGFREAWEEGDTGTEIAKTMLGAFEDVLSTINDMTRATSEWADNLNFSPILQSINGLFSSMRPTIQWILDLLSVLYTDVLLPIGKWVIEDAFPASIDVLSAAFGVLNAAFDALRPLGRWLLDNFLSPLGNWAGDGVVWILEKLADALGGIGTFISNHQRGFSNFVIAFGAFAGTLALFKGLTVVVGIVTSIFNIFASIKSAAGLIALVKFGLAPLVAILGGPIVLAIAGAIAAGTLLWKNWDTVKEKATQLGRWIGQKWSDIRTSTSNTWNNVKTKTSETWSDMRESAGKWFTGIKDRITGNSKTASDDAIKNYKNMEVNSSSFFGAISGAARRFFPETTRTITNRVEEARKNVSDRWSSMWANSRDRFNEIKNNASTRFSETKDSISRRSREAWEDTRTSFGNMRDNAQDRFREISNNARDRFDEVRSNVSERANTARDNATSAFRTLRDNISGSMSTIRSTVSSAFDKVAEWSSDLGSRIARGLRGGIDAIRDVTRSIGNTLVRIPGRAVNGVLGGVRWVLNRVGAKSMAENLTNYTIPTYMHGTGYHPGGLAMVNDAPGGYYREAYQLPDGQIGLFPNERNLMVDLPRGAKVLNGEDTHSMVHLDPDIPGYRNGIGNFFSKAWNKAQDMVGSVWDYVSNPSKLLEIAVSKFVNLTDSVQPQLDMARGAVSTASEGALGLITRQLERGQSEGTGRPSTTATATRTATNTASGGGVNFKGLRQTSPFGYRIHPIFGTRRLHAGVDFAGGQGIGHPIHAQAGGNVTYGGPSSGGWGTYVRIRQGLMDYIYAHLNRALVSPGQRVSRGQLIGQMGNTGDSTGPHVHYEVRRGGSPINPMNTISGYANGGMVRRDQMIRIAEQNKPEMVIPLTRPGRALELIDQALDFMGMDLSALSMPELFDTPYEDLSVSRNFDSTGQDSFDAPAPISHSIVEAIQLLLGQVGTGNASQDAEIVLQVGEAQLGRVVIKAINKLTQKTGQTLLIV